MKNNSIKSFIKHALLLTLSLSVFFSSCKKDDDQDPDNDQELITTVKVTLKKSDVDTGQTFEWKDIDGAGGQDPVIQTISVDPNSTYSMTVEFLDESKNPAENITGEILEEAEDHMVLFIPEARLNFAVMSLDTDANNQLIGLENRVVTGTSSTGNLRIILKHQPDKTKPDTTGETDVDVTFPVTVR